MRPTTAGPASAPVDDERTVLRPPRTVSPQLPPNAAPAPAAPVGVPAQNGRRRVGLWVTLGAVALVLITGTIVGISLLSGTDEPDPVATQDEVVPQDPVSDAVPRVDELVGTRTGTTITFSWTNPAPEDGDLYLWNTVDLTATGTPETTEETTVTFEGAASGQVCVDVMLRRSDGRASEPVRECVQ